ncbi:hypothetical protein J3458_015164 [Metarhizium acridum]|uniref:uncharacterized protein n=1 Tax=Metarhizium acridum TaxID=92637 RepID=UPI001C6CD138|nr:hypothetical protein J3458_015164 [Metarhizium acridum]
MLAQILTICLVLLRPFVGADIFDGFTESTLVPWLENQVADPFANTVHVSMRLSCTGTVDCVGGRTKDYKPVVDTGSTGIMLVAKEIPDFIPGTCPTEDVGWQYLSSSDKLYRGCWIKKEVVFNPGSASTTQPEMTATVPVLAVTESAFCDPRSSFGEYDVLAAPNTCPDPTVVFDTNPTTLSMLGIGFGRQKSGQPQGYPDKNPFLQMTTVAGHAVNWFSYRPGWVITKRGVHSGLTNFNAGGSREFRYTRLPPHHPPSPPSAPPVPRHPLDWDQLDGCIKFTYDTIIGGTPTTVVTPCVKCKVLLDTGFQRGFVRLRSPTTDAVMPRTGSGASPLKAGAIIDVSFGSPAIDGERFTVAAGRSGAGAAPDNDIRAVYSTRLPRFVNAGSHAFRLKKMAFDAISGAVGFAPA